MAHTVDSVRRRFLERVGGTDALVLGDGVR